MITTNFNSSNLNSIRRSVEKALKSVELEFGIKLDMGNISYTNETFTSKLSAKVKTADANLFYKYNLPNLQGKVFRYKGVDYKITGMNPAKRRYPITTEVLLTGAVMNFNIDCVKEILKF